MQDSRWLPTLFDIVRAANEARTGTEALTRALELLVERLGMDGGTARLRGSEQVVRRGAPGSFSAVSIPVWVDDEVAAVLDLFGRPKSLDLYERASQVGALLSPALERDRRQEAVARRLHDGLAQEVTGLAFLARSLEEELAGFPRAARKARRIVTSAQRAVLQARFLTRDFLDVEVREIGLNEALLRFASGVRDRYGIPCRFESRGFEPEPPAAEHLYYIAQEAATNAAKHSGAGKIVIRLDGDGSSIRLTVEDDGRGFPPREPGGSGLRIMRGRAAAIGASFAIEPRPGGGTRVGVFASRGGDPWPRPSGRERAYSSSTITR